jgi:hypothetical protein
MNTDTNREKDTNGQGQGHKRTETGTQLDRDTDGQGLGHRRIGTGTQTDRQRGRNAN